MLQFMSPNSRLQEIIYIQPGAHSDVMAAQNSPSNSPRVSRHPPPPPTIGIDSASYVFPSSWHGQPRVSPVNERLGNSVIHQMLYQEARSYSPTGVTIPEDNSGYHPQSMAVLRSLQSKLQNLTMRFETVVEEFRNEFKALIASVYDDDAGEFYCVQHSESIQETDIMVYICNCF